MTYQPKISFCKTERDKWCQPLFSNEEYQTRQAKIKEKMQQKGLDALLIYDNGSLGHSYYLTNYNPFIGDTVLFCQPDNDFVLFTNFLLHGEPMNSSIWQCILSEVFPLPALDFAQNVAQITKGRVKRNAALRLGLIGTGKITANLLQQLKAKLDIKEIVALDNDFMQLRAIKSPQEIKIMEKAAAISGQAIQNLASKIECGQTEKEVFAMLASELFTLGATGLSFAPTVSKGARAGLKHVEPSGAVLKEGDVVFIDVGAAYEGYLADISRCLVLGQPPGEILQLVKASEELFAVAIKEIEPDLPVTELIIRLQKKAQQLQVNDLFMENLIGHGLGITLLEKPRLEQNSTDVIVENMIFALEPMLVKYNWGTFVVEDMVLVQEDGVRLLSNLKGQSIYL